MRISDWSSDVCSSDLAIRQEAPDERDIAVYLSDPHVLLAQAPEALFLDPSHTFRLDFQRYRPRRDRVQGVYIRRVRSMLSVYPVGLGIACNCSRWSRIRRASIAASVRPASP